MNTIRQGSRRIARILTSLLYPRSSGGTFFNQESRRQINSNSILVETYNVNKQATPLLDQLNSKKITDLNSNRNLVIGYPIHTMDATKNPVIFQLRNQNNEVIRTSKISDVFHSNKNFKPLLAPPKNNKIIYSNEPLLNNIVRSTMNLQPMSLADYENDLQELVILFKFYTNKEPPFDDSDLEMFSRMAKDFYEIRYSDQILISESSDDDELMSLGII